MRNTWIPLVLASLLAVGLPAGPLHADSDGKGSDIGGPPEARSKKARRFGVDPSELTDAEKQARLEAIEKEYEDLRRNQDIIQTRTRRNRVNFVGEMRYEPSGDFLKKVYDVDRDLRTQVAALVAIGKSGDFEVIQYAVKKSLSQARKQPVYALSIPRMFAGCRHPEAGKWLLGRLKGVRDQWVLAALIEALGYTGEPAAVDVLTKIAKENKSDAVRFEALRALGSCAGTEAYKNLLPFLTNEDWRLRMAAAEGLGRSGNRDVISDLAKLIGKTQKPIVVETATEAVGALGGKDAVEPLIQCLEVGRLRARNKARQSLIKIAREEFRQTKDYFTDAAAWRSWWKKARNPGTGVGQTPRAAKGESETISYFGVKIHSDSVLFVLDVSGSMKWPDPPRESGIKPKDWDKRRIDLAHNEMFNTLRQLRPETRFNVATFAGVVTPWTKDGEVPATKENIEAAISWIRQQLPRGGTATYDALRYGIEDTEVDTIYFLSDGVPSLGRYEDTEEILAAVRLANRYRRVSINTIALIVGKSPIEKALKYEDPQEMAEFMGRIAEENYGTFVDESRP